MTPAELEKELKSGKIRPVYLVAGEERFLSDQIVRALRARLVEPGMADFNEDIFSAGEVPVEKVLGAVRMAPMMSERRFVLVRSLERWEGRSEEKEPAPGKQARETPMEQLARYAEQPVPSTCLVLQGGKLDQRRKLAAAAKKQNFLVSCEPLDRRALKGWIERAFKERGHPVEGGVPEHLAEIAGPELGYVADAVERLCLFVGQGARVTAAAVAEVVTRVRETDVWGLSTAVGERDFPRALGILEEVYAPYEGVRLVGLLASSIRKLLAFSLALQRGVPPEEAARTAGVPPFKVREAVAQARALPVAELERWMFLLAEADGALKSSRRPERAVLEGLILDMVGGPRPAGATL
ncbi:MAG: DNA polymerase III subunit delta [Polyangiaceae bacterium]|jgi:DNA polymerase-3 subunit delta|nr:DNA polymerase III subunit delta [Polyangiaceae bacterium]